MSSPADDQWEHDYGKLEAECHTLRAELAALRGASAAEHSVVAVCGEAAMEEMEDMQKQIDSLRAANERMTAALIWVRDNNANDWLGTGSDRKWADKQQSEWDEIIAAALAAPATQTESQP